MNKVRVLEKSQEREDKLTELVLRRTLERYNSYMPEYQIEDNLPPVFPPSHQSFKRVFDRLVSEGIIEMTEYNKRPVYRLKRELGMFRKIIEIIDYQ